MSTRDADPLDHDLEPAGSVPEETPDAYTVSEAYGVRTYRCTTCGSTLNYLVEKVPPGQVGDIDRVARQLIAGHCRGRGERDLG